jgi:hypothetical protein
MSWLVLVNSLFQAYNELLMKKFPPERYPHWHLTGKNPVWAE